MAAIYSHLPSFSLRPISFPVRRSSSPCLPSRARISYSSVSSSPSPIMHAQTGTSTTFTDFPYVSDQHRDLMVDLVSTIETRLDSVLLPSTLPPDVQSYKNQNGTAHASLHLRSGAPSSQIDFILGSWLHCELPSGGALNITSLSAYLKSLTDAPNFLVELIQSDPTSMVLILDLPPRKDLVLNPDYLKTFYEDTQLDQKRQLLEKLPEVKPYFTSSLYIRCVVSPTAVLVRIETEAGETEQLDEIVRKHVSTIAKEVLGTWLDLCACGKREVGVDDKIYLENRDNMTKSKTIEIDLGSNLPRLFGQEVATKVLEALRQYF